MTSAHDRRLTLVTVVFESEVRLLALQARSLRLFATGLDLHRIIVIDNTARGLTPRTLAQLRAEYGPLADLLSVVRPGALGGVPKGLGWYVQQVLKLQVAQLVETDRYVALDAKNIAVGPLRPDFFADERGRPRGTAYSYETHPLRGGLERVLRYLDVDPAPHVARFTATVTPFVFDTAVVLDLIASVEKRAERPFAAEFIEHDLLEFFLYSGHLVGQGRSLDDVFALDRVPCPIVWPRGATEAAVRQAAEAVRAGAPVISVHRKALGRLEPDAVGILTDLWTEAGLFDDAAQARAYVHAFRSELATQERRRKLRELGTRGRRAWASRREAR